MIEEINFSNISLVYIDDKTKTPHCLKHGAMNKLTKFEDNRGIWRCISVISNHNDTVCRAGCKY